MGLMTKAQAVQRAVNVVKQSIGDIFDTTGISDTEILELDAQLSEATGNKMYFFYLNKISWQKGIDIINDLCDINLCEVELHFVDIQGMYYPDMLEKVRIGLQQDVTSFILLPESELDELFKLADDTHVDFACCYGSEEVSVYMHSCDGRTTTDTNFIMENLINATSLNAEARSKERKLQFDTNTKQFAGRIKETAVNAASAAPGTKTDVIYYPFDMMVTTLEHLDSVYQALMPDRVSVFSHEFDYVIINNNDKNIYIGIIAPSDQSVHGKLSRLYMVRTDTDDFEEVLFTNEAKHNELFGVTIRSIGRWV